MAHLGEALGEALGKALGKALGEALRRTLGTGTTELLRSVRAGNARSIGTRRTARDAGDATGSRHASVVVRRRRGRTIGGTHARVVLRTAPRQANARVPDRIALHLVDGHLGGMAVDELDESAALAGGDLHVGDLAKSLEEGAQLVLGDVARQSTDKDSRIVWIGELVHRLLDGVEGVRVLLIGRHAPTHLAIVAGHLWNRTGRALRAMAILVRPANRALDWSLPPKKNNMDEPGLGGGSRDPHGAVAAVDSLHLNQGALLIALITKANEAVAARLASHGIRHDLGRLARRKAGLEERDQHEFVNFGAEVADEDGELGAAVVTE